MRCYTDFYHHRHAIVDTREAWRVPARPEHLNKLAVSWNLGLGSYACRDSDLTARLRGLRPYWPFAKYAWKHTPAVATTRPVDITLRGRLNYERETVTFQRQETHRRLVQYASDTGYATGCDGRLPYSQYREEIRRSKIVLSPFGFGEMNIRDVECFVDGAALVKPDMSHLVTWPDYFEPNTTYAAYAWDFSDFDATLARLLANTEERLRIARAGQERYLHSLSEEGGSAFGEHFLAVLQQARQ